MTESNMGKFMNRIIRGAAVRLRSKFSGNDFRYMLHDKLGLRFEPRIPEFPPMVLIESTNRCNLSCAHCPHQTLLKNPDYKLGDIDEDLFMRLIDEISQHPGTIVRPFSDGEPLLYKPLIRVMKYANRKGVSHIWINTNGILLNEEMAYGLVEAEISNLEVSIDAYSEEMYRRIRRNDKFEQVKKNVLFYMELKRKLLPTATVSVSFVASKDNIHEQDDFLRYWKDKVDSVLIRPFHRDSDNILTNNKTREFRAKKRWPCRQLWERVTINFDGKARFCVSDWLTRGLVGDANIESINEIWHGEVINRYRKLVLDGRFDEVPACSSCQDWEHWRWNA